jgi:MerR family transcriptional regulator, copper efflux regulator
MAAQGLKTGELARRAGTTRKALRLYEAAGLVAPMARTASGYRVYRQDALDVLTFVLKARRVGFSIIEIREILGIRRAGRAPCDHVRHLIRRKVADLERTLEELTAARQELRALLKSWRNLPKRSGTVCAHIERLNGAQKKEVSR